jgi:hypothetical protein
MTNLTIAVLAPPDYAKDTGKKGTVSDITFYNLKKRGCCGHFHRTNKVPGKNIIAFFSVTISMSRAPGCVTQGMIKNIIL